MPRHATIQTLLKSGLYFGFGLGLGLGLGPATGCAPKQARPTANLSATDTPSRVPAIVSAAGQNDAHTLGELVHALADKDPAIRMFAIQSLQRRTNQTLGYRYYDGESDRLEAITRWHQWLAEQDGGETAAVPTP